MRRRTIILVAGLSLLIAAIAVGGGSRAGSLLGAHTSSPARNSTAPAQVKRAAESLGAGEPALRLVPQRVSLSGGRSFDL
ncbi:MAG TPA: hypothetical protein VF507_08065, partial [Pyrinomonadaceae bacterium]